MKYKKIRIGDKLYIKGRIGWKGLKKSEYLPHSDYLIINGEALLNGYVDWSKAGYISENRYLESPEIMLQNNDILISKDGTIGKVAMIKELNTFVSVASGIFVVRNNDEDSLNTRYLYYFLISKSFKDFIKSRTEGSVIPHLYQKDFINLEIPYPSINVQNKIVNILDSITRKIELNTKINDNLYSYT